MYSFSYLDSLDATTKRETGKTAQINNIQAAKVINSLFLLQFMNFIDTIRLFLILFELLLVQDQC